MSGNSSNGATGDNGMTIPWDFSRLTVNYNNQQHNIERTPPHIIMQSEVLREVLSRLPISELQNCRLVCKQWEQEATKIANRKRRIRLWSREEISTHFNESNCVERRLYHRFSMHGDQHSDPDSRAIYLQFLQVFGKQVLSLNMSHPVPGFLQSVFGNTPNLQILNLALSKISTQFDDSEYDFYVPSLRILRIIKGGALFSDELLILNLIPRTPNITELSLENLPNGIVTIAACLSKLKFLKVTNHLGDKEIDNLLQCHLMKLEYLDLGVQHSVTTKTIANLFFKIGATLTDLTLRAVPKIYDDQYNPHRIQDWLKCMWQLKHLRSLTLSWFPDVDPTVLQGHFFTKLSKLVLDGHPPNSLFCASIGHNHMDYDHPRLPNIKSLHIWNSVTAEIAQFHVVDTFSCLTEFHGYITPKSLCVLLTGIPSLKSVNAETYMKRYGEDYNFVCDLSLHSATQDLLNLFQLSRMQLKWATQLDISEILMILSQRKKLEWLKLEESPHGAGPEVRFDHIKPLIDNTNLSYFNFSFKTFKPSIGEFEYIWKKMCDKILYIGGQSLNTENLGTITSTTLFRFYNKIFSRR